ncbi:MAG: pilus assembly protein TadG-related protein [Actinomycetota bacterium]
MNRVRSEERGAVIPIVVLSLIAIFGMVVLTVDVGGTLTKRRSMVNASDAAALAAAQSFSMRIEAVCGTNEAPAQAKADQLAQSNVTTAVHLTGTAGFQTDCTEQTVAVGYGTNQQLFFAPVLGFPNTTPVSTSATAKWGPPTGGATMPVELDPLTTNACIYPGGTPGSTFNPPGVCTKGYWFDNGDLTNSGWGMMNLNQWGVDPAASCDNSGGANDLSGWIDQSNPDLVHLVGTTDPVTGYSNPPTYVCTTDGGKTPNWMAALQGWATEYQNWVAAGEPTNDPAVPVPPTFLFPINDPSQMVFGPPTSIQKYAIVGFAPMQIVAIYDVGTDQTAAIGGSASCTAGYTFPAFGSSVDLTSAALNQSASPSTPCPGSTPRSQIQNVTVSPATGGKAYSLNSDYVLVNDASGNITGVQWKKAGPVNVKISFDYRSGGACPGHAPDPNAFCLQLAWGGPAILGEGPATGYGPAMTVQLVK